MRKGMYIWGSDGRQIVEVELHHMECNKYTSVSYLLYLGMTLILAYTRQGSNNIIKIMLFLKATDQSYDLPPPIPKVHPIISTLLSWLQIFSKAAIILTGRSYVFIIAQLLHMTPHNKILGR
jgi:hypothetical protein